MNHSDDYENGVRLIGDRAFADAIEILESGSGCDSCADIQQLLGLAHFHLQQYEQAVEHFAAAFELSPENTDIRYLLDMAGANAQSELDVAVPPLEFFDREILLAAPGNEAVTPPAAWAPADVAGGSMRLRLYLGHALGWISTAAMDLATNLWGHLAGYRRSIWTNWYDRPLPLGILTLAFMREQLNKHNLISSYPKGTLVGFQRAGQTPPESARHYRFADGSWNNLADPKEGAAGTRFLRNACARSVGDALNRDLMTPNPREISRRLLTRSGTMKEVPFLNLLAASWIQFQNHDWVNHGEILNDDPLQIPLADDDPVRVKYHQTAIRVGRTQPDPTRHEEIEEMGVTHINEVTHWWDGSQVYGSDLETVRRLRSGVDGKLAMVDDNTLPLTPDGVEDSGFVRNWWVGLAMLHTLFAREHNEICNTLKAAHPDWHDDQLFNVARLINAAVMAKIHTVEWTPAILPNRGLDAGLNANWYGIVTNLFRSGTHRKTLAEINIENPELGGVVGNPINKHGQPYGLTEEFVEVYRLHSLLPESLTIRRMGTDNATEEVPLPVTRQAGSRKLTQRIPMVELFYSFGKQHPGQLVLNNYPQFMQEMSAPGNPLFDLGAVDILRARERGVPRYNEFRRQLQLNEIRSFSDLTDDSEQLAELRALYGENPDGVENLDLMIGTLAEDLSHRPDKFGFGETMFQIFILNATRRLQADRFYTDDYNAQTYTQEGLEWIDDADLKTVLLRHYPSLRKTGLANIKNAFEPWDDGPRLDEKAHPLRAYDKELMADPWCGDRFR